VMYQLEGRVAPASDKTTVRIPQFDVSIFGLPTK